MKDYYKILEIKENATDDEIKRSFRNLSRKYHPDVNPNGEEKFKEIVEAYETLGDQKKRQKYDFTKNNPHQDSSLQDLFAQMFGGAPPGFRQQRRKQAPDKVIKLEVSPIESYFGSEKNIKYTKENGCEPCKGTGGEQQTCNQCNGSGFQVRVFGTGFMVQQIRTACPTCGGKGFTLIHKCNSCDGRGFQSQINEVKIKLPVGVDNGQFLRLDNLGDFRGGEYGDLVIQIELMPKDGFEKMNNDLVYSLYLDLNEIQKDKFIISHPDGDLKVDVPKIVDTSKPLKLRGKGYQGGDMYIKLFLKFERSI